MTSTQQVGRTQKSRGKSGGPSPGAATARRDQAAGREIDADALREAIEAIEGLDAEIQSLNEDKKAAYAKARAAGLDVKILKALVHERRIPPDEFGAFLDLLAAYREAIGG